MNLISVSKSSCWPSLVNTVLVFMELKLFLKVIWSSNDGILSALQIDLTLMSVFYLSWCKNMVGIALIEKDSSSFTKVIRSCDGNVLDILQIISKWICIFELFCVQIWWLYIPFAKNNEIVFKNPRGLPIMTSSVVFN